MTYDPRRQLGCDGDDDCIGGYRTVTEAYVNKMCPWLGPPIDEPETEREREFNERAQRDNEAYRAALRNSSYPCPNCNPDQFLRWTEGDWPNPKRRSKADNRPPGSDPGPTDPGDEPADFEEAVPT